MQPLENTSIQNLYAYAFSQYKSFGDSNIEKLLKGKEEGTFIIKPTLNGIELFYVDTQQKIKCDRYSELKNSVWNNSHGEKFDDINSLIKLYELKNIHLKKTNFQNNPFVKDYNNFISINDIVKYMKTNEIQGKLIPKFFASIGINNMKKEGQETIINIAKFIAQRDVTLISKVIKDFGINEENQEDLIEITKIAAKTFPKKTSEFIQKFGIEKDNQKAFIEIAKIAAENSAEMIEFIEKYDIKDQTALIEIAEIAARTNGKITSEHIQDFGIDKENQKALIKIAKIAAKTDGKMTSKFIKNFGIDEKNQEALLEIAKIAAENDAKMYKFIENYEIKEPTAFIEIAKVLAKKDEKITLKFIQQYKIKKMENGQDTLIEIAKIMASSKGGEAFEYISKFGIDKGNQEALIEIAKIAAKTDGKSTSHYLHNLGIDISRNQQALIEIAKIALSQGGLEALKYLSNYEFGQSEGFITKLHIEAAWVLATQLREVQNFSQIFHHLPFAFTKILSPLDQKETLQDKVKFGLRELIEFSKEMPYLPIDELKKEIESFHKLEWMNLIDKKEIQEMIQTQKNATQKQIQELNKKSKLTKEQIDAIKKEIQESNKNQTEEQVNELIKNKFKDLNKENKELIKSIKNQEKEFIEEQIQKLIEEKKQTLTEEQEKLIEEQIQMRQLQFIQNFAIMTAKIRLTLTNIPYEPNIINDIKEVLFQGLKTRNPRLRQAQLSMIIQNLIPPLENSIFYPINNEKSLYQTIKDEKTGNYAFVLNSLLAELSKESPDQLKSLKNLAKRIYQLTSSKENVFLKNADLAQLLTGIVIDLIRNTALSFQEKQTLLENLFKGEFKHIEKALRAIKGLLNTKEEGMLKNLANTKFESSEQFYQGLNDQYTTAFKKLLPLNFEEMTLDNVLDFIHTFRDPQTIINYAATLKKLTEPDQELMLKNLADCLEKAVKGMFPFCRYEGSDHLNNIFQNPSLVNEFDSKWKENHHFPLNQILTKNKDLSREFVIVDTDDINDLFVCGTEVNSCQNINGDPNYSKALLGYVMDGKNRLIAIKDENGTIQARCILRLLIDDNTKKPALFLEPIYSNSQPLEGWEEAIIEMAKRKAETLQIPLYSKDVYNKNLTKDRSSKNKLVLTSLDSLAPYEYVDSTSGENIVKKHGTFTIANAHLVV